MPIKRRTRAGRTNTIVDYGGGDGTTSGVLNLQVKRIVKAVKKHRLKKKTAKNKKARNLGRRPGGPV